MIGVKPRRWIYACALSVAANVSLVACAAGYGDELQSAKKAPSKVGHRAVVDLHQLLSEHDRLQRKLRALQVEEAKLAKDRGLPTQPSPPLSGIDWGFSDDRGYGQPAVVPLTGERIAKHISALLETYVEIEKLAADFARRHGIELIVNYREVKPLDCKTPDEAKALFDQDVIYQNRIDISRDLLR